MLSTDRVTTGQPLSSGEVSRSSSTSSLGNVEDVSYNEKIELRSALQRFAWDIHAALARNAPERSFSCSPLSLLPILGMLLKGMAYEEDQRAVLDRLCIQMAPERFHLVLKAMTYEALGDEDAQLGLKSANAAITQPGWQLSPAFQDALERYYGAEVFQEAGGSLLDTVNHWVREQTGGQIPALLEQVSEDALLLVNALAFEGRWQDGFSVEASFPAEFTCVDGSLAPCTLMEKDDEVLHYEAEDFSCVSLPYKSQSGKNCSFMAFVPKDPAGLRQLENILSESFVMACQSCLEERSIQLLLPRLSLSHSEGELKRLLSDMALPMDADLGAIASGASLDQLIQKVHLSLDEAGTCAAAASAAMSFGTSSKSEKPMVRADHPFAYAIMLEGLPLFTGVVKEGSALMSEEEAATRRQLWAER